MNFKSLKAHLSSIEGKVAIKTSLAAGLSFFLGTAVSHLTDRADIFISGVWTTQAAIVVQQTHLGSTYRSAWMRFLGVLIGCFFGGLLTVLLGSTPISLSVAIFMTVILCSMISIKDSTRIACLSVTIVMILWGLHPETSPWVFSFYRFLDSCLGISVAVLIAHSLWPARINTKIGQSVANTLQNLSRMFRLAANLNEASSDQIQEFRQLAFNTHELFWKNRQILEDSRLELLTKHTGLELWQLLFAHLEKLYEQIFTLSNVYRVHLNAMIDQGLDQQFKKITSECDKLLLEYALVLQGSSSQPELSELEAAVNGLDNELVRFRATRTTSKYELNDVEGFYVFFYTLKEAAEEIIKSRKEIAILMD